MNWETRLEDEIIEAYFFLKEKNTSLSSSTLEFIRQASLDRLKKLSSLEDKHNFFYLKNNTIADDNMMFDGQYYRYVNHEEQLLTSGFSTKDTLVKSKNLILFNDKTILSMRNRYNSFYLINLCNESL